MIDRYLDEHYRKTLDQPLSVLEDHTPRESVTDPALRPLVVAWLKGLENTGERRARAKGREPDDCGWIWEELGIEKR